MQQWLLGTQLALQQSAGLHAADSATTAAAAATSTSPATAATAQAEDTSAAAYLSLLLRSHSIRGINKNQSTYSSLSANLNA
jgi:hypothetical protein